MLTLENSSGLAAVLAARYLETLQTEDLVQWAQDALAEGHDSSSLLRLAIAEPPYFTPDLIALFEATLSELGLEELTNDQVRIFHAQQLARRLLDSGESPRAIAQRLSRLLPAHDSPEWLRGWWEIEEAFWCEYCRMGVEQSGETLEQVVLRRANELMEADWRAP